MTFTLSNAAEYGRLGGLKRGEALRFINTPQLVEDYNTGMHLDSISKKYGRTFRSLYRYLEQADQREPGSVHWRNRTRNHPTKLPGSPHDAQCEGGDD